MIPWDDFRLVRAIAETGSLAGAAEQLAVNHSTVFRRLGTLEQQLGARLFERARAGYVPTPMGEGLLVTLQLTLYSRGMGALLALLCALALVSSNVALRWPAQAFTYFMRGTPLLIQVYLIYYGVAQPWPASLVLRFAKNGVPALVWDGSWRRRQAKYMNEIGLQRFTSKRYKLSKSLQKRPGVTCPSSSGRRRPRA